MNIKKKNYTNYIGLRLTKEEYDLLLSTLCRKKGDKLSQKLRDYLFTKIKEEPVIEYTISQNAELMAVTLYQKDIIIDTLFFDNIGSAMSHIKSINAVKKES